MTVAETEPFQSPTSDTVAMLKADLVAANRILLGHDIVDAFGHVSVRHPHDSSRFLMARRVPPGLVQADDIRVYGLDGELIDKDGSSSFLERFIHSEIFAARPDVHAIVHSHSANIVAFGIAPAATLQAVCHTCGFLKGPTPVFEIRDVGGDCTDLMISNPAYGRSLVEKLGDGSVVLMRGHGSTVVGKTLGQAVYRAIYTEVNARIQASAMSFGPVTFLSEGEADAVEAVNDLQVERTWQFWKSEVALQEA